MGLTHIASLSSPCLLLLLLFKLLHELLLSLSLPSLIISCIPPYVCILNDV
jgi:hypothetical protein